MFTTALWFSLLLVSRAFADLLVSDVYSSQSQCDTAADLFKNSKGETPCTVILQLLVPCNVNVSEASTANISASACACNIEFYNLLSACALLCVKQSVDPFYEWTESCDQIVPMTRDYPYTSVITTVIPPWASKQLSSGGNFDPSIVMGGDWTTLQKVTPVIVGLGVLILAGLFWYLCRVYRRRRSSRRAQGAYSRTNHSLGHRRDESAGSYSSTSHLKAMNASELSLPLHRIRYFFSGMFPVRERRRNSDWNIEGEPGLPRRSSITNDPSSHRESDSFFTPTSSIHAQNDTPPTSPAVNWSPFQTISRWWTSTSLPKGREAVHLLSARKGSKFGADDDNHLEPVFMSPPPRNQASNIRNDRTSEEEVPSVIIVSNGGRESVSSPQSLETEPTGNKRLLSLRPNRPGHIVAIEDPSSSQSLSYADVPTISNSTPDLSAFPPPPGIREQTSNDTFYTSRTNLSTDQVSEQTVRPRKLSPQLLFPASVRAAGYSVPQQPKDPAVLQWTPRVDSTSNGQARNTDTEPPSYDQAHGPTTTPTFPPPSSHTSTHPYPYTNHLRSASDVTVPGVSRSARPRLQDLDTINTQNTLNRLSLAVNEPTSALPTLSDNGSGDGNLGFTPTSIVQGSDVSKNLEYTPYPSSAVLPLPDVGVSRGGYPPYSRS